MQWILICAAMVFSLMRFQMWMEDDYLRRQHPVAPIVVASHEFIWTEEPDDAPLPGRRMVK